MTSTNETAPAAGPGRLQKSAHAGSLNTSGDTPNPDRWQDRDIVHELDDLIEASNDVERHIARRALMQRRMTLNLICLRDHYEDLGRVFWKGARP